MKRFKYVLECVGYGILVAIVVHGMISLAGKMTIGVWLSHGEKDLYIFTASVAMFGSLYALFDILNKKVSNKKWYHYKYARYILFAMFVVTPAITWSTYKLTYSGPLRMTVIAERQPLFVVESNGAIQNKYTLKLVNETGQDFHVTFNSISNMKDLSVLGTETPLLIKHGKVNVYTIFIRVPEKYVTQEVTAIEFKVQSTEDQTMQATYKTIFHGPKAEIKN